MGSDGRTRTGDTTIMSRLLYRLSYTALHARYAEATAPVLECRVGHHRQSGEPPNGIEPLTFSLPWKRSAD